ncbi:S-adenosyl-L-methionine-dependent methyltransferase [Planomonospora venezuelensis]|nr:SAM-dependent methyltransferase [Planomonospora venezuelensis]GIN05443.1 S-adenosyl-L-methionine-dependent methyltransferase [Planomonospora venezuelensis]
MAAAARAAHLIVDGEPRIFTDPLAYRLLGAGAEEMVGYHRSHGGHPVLAGARVSAVTRSRYTEDRLAQGARRGLTQYVVLGAGLDSFAYRPEAAAGIRVFEVDHPATQRWKRDLLAGAGIAVPDTVAFVPADFEDGSLADRLAAGGFDPARPAFVSWLGVSMYLTGQAVGRMLDVVAGFAPGSELVLDHLLPEELRDEAGRAYAEAVMAVAAQGGEPWVSFFGPEEMSSLLEEHAFEVIGHASQRDSVEAALWERSDALRPSGLVHLAHARIPGPA